MCNGCGVTFKPTSNRQIYCTRACRIKTKNPPPASLVCEVCGKEFARTRRTASCCSEACRGRRRYLANTAAYKKAAKVWKASHPEAVKESERNYYRRNRENRIKWREANRERLRGPKAAAVRRWRAANPEAVRAMEWRRRHAIRNHPDTRIITPRDWARLVNRFGGCCAYCGRRSENLHLDHVIPVSRGGRHGIGNALPACRECNQSKTNFLLTEWRLRLRKRGAPLAGLGDHMSVRPPGQEVA
jgi:5-methylcytosine-specific restriction endonuclease McrA